jgi:exopolysaccharide biosynthesis polyprenyl glycosylphosphotransferase
MIQRFSTNFGVFSFFFDLAITSGTIFLSRILRPFLDHLIIFQPLDKPDIPLAIYILFPVIWVTFLLSFSVYDGKKNLKVIDEFSNLTLASMMAAITLAGLLYFTYRDISRGFFLTYLGLAFGFLLLWRIIARIIHKRNIEDEKRKFKILIVGAGSVGNNLKQKLESNGKEHFRFIGFLDDSPEKLKTYKDVIGSLNEAREIVTRKKVNRVIIALPMYAYEKVDQLINDLYDLPVSVSVIPDYFQLCTLDAKLNEFAGLPVLDLRTPAFTEYQRLIKRIFDLLVTSLLLIPVIPVMVFTSLLILIFDGVPVLFIQDRIGENGQIIKIYKFRTMIPEAENLHLQVDKKDKNGSDLYKSKGDPRITRLGRFLRRFSLDELPQFFNILQGTLSLVGPRPELPRIVETYQPWQRARLTVPQGLTGWWQVQGRSDKPLHLNIEKDLYYIENYSIWLDLRIIVKTIWTVLRGKGAY